MGTSLSGPPVWEDGETMVSHGATVPFWGMEHPDVRMVLEITYRLVSCAPRIRAAPVCGSRNALQQHSDQVCCWRDPWWALRLP